MQKMGDERHKMRGERRERGRTENGEEGAGGRAASGMRAAPDSNRERYTTRKNPRLKLTTAVTALLRGAERGMHM